jgi:hypothetical protein
LPDPPGYEPRDGGRRYDDNRRLPEDRDHRKPHQAEQDAEKVLSLARNSDDRRGDQRGDRDADASNALATTGRCQKRISAEAITMISATGR